jgi:hypothetical protein
MPAAASSAAVLQIAKQCCELMSHNFDEWLEEVGNQLPLPLS